MTLFSRVLIYYKDSATSPIKYRIFRFCACCMDRSQLRWAKSMSKLGLIQTLFRNTTWIIKTLRSSKINSEKGIQLRMCQVCRFWLPGFGSGFPGNDVLKLIPGFMDFLSKKLAKVCRSLIVNVSVIAKMRNYFHSLALFTFSFEKTIIMFSSESFLHSIVACLSSYLYFSLFTLTGNLVFFVWLYPPLLVEAWPIRIYLWIVFPGALNHDDWWDLKLGENETSAIGN